MKIDKTPHLFAVLPVGAVFAATGIDSYGTVRRARRTVNADGSPRAGLTRWRVVAHATPAALPASALVDCGLTQQRGPYSLVVEVAS